MPSLAKLLYVVGALPTVGGIAVLVALAPRPTRIKDHLQGAARYLIVFGMGISAARVFMGWTPSWELVALSLGLGLGMAMHARENNLVALAQERIEQAGRDAGA